MILAEIRIGGTVIECETGENLRRVLLNSNSPLYSRMARALHCRGLGTCGTCALRVKGPVSTMTAVEKWRLSFPPHRVERGLRLACQCIVLGDLNLPKHAGFWGHKVSDLR
jgi:ferredoxin